MQFATDAEKAADRDDDVGDAPFALADQHVGDGADLLAIRAIDGGAIDAVARDGVIAAFERAVGHVHGVSPLAVRRFATAFVAKEGADRTMRRFGGRPGQHGIKG